MSRLQLGRVLFWFGCGGSMYQLISMVLWPELQNPWTWTALGISAVAWAVGSILIGITPEETPDLDAYERYLLHDDWYPECPTHGTRHCLMPDKGCPIIRTRHQDPDRRAE